MRNTDPFTAKPDRLAPRKWDTAFRLAFTLTGVLVILSLPGPVPGADVVFERIRQSLPQTGEGWTIAEVEKPQRQRDGAQQAGFVWARGAEEVGATVVAYPSTKAAKDQFRGSGKDGSSIKGFLVDDIGDEAYLFPPVIRNQAGPFALSFRKARYVVWMSTQSRETLVRCAKHIADSIAGAGVVQRGAAPSRTSSKPRRQPE